MEHSKAPHKQEKYANKNDVTDGIAITAIIILATLGVIYFLYCMP